MKELVRTVEVIFSRGKLFWWYMFGGREGDGEGRVSGRIPTGFAPLNWVQSRREALPVTKRFPEI
jgi:hypothetical protein